jgi:hypothetical protein
MMMDHMIRNKYLATSQKGFIEGTSGCLEHHYQLEEIMKGLKENYNLFYCTTDIRSAYRSVNHEMIHWALNHYSFKQLIKSMYARQTIYMNKAFADDAKVWKILERFNEYVKMEVAQEKFNVFKFTREERRIVTKDVIIKFNGANLPNSR